jgi:hypothetical protein
MPIRPENKHRYPANWKEIRVQILERARYRCEHPGCNAAHHAEGYWLDDKFKPLNSAMRDAGFTVGSVSHSADGGTIKIIRIVLTIAHLDHQPENCDPSNLRAWCQKHHLAYDAEHHAVTRARTRHENANTLELFQ